MQALYAFAVGGDDADHVIETVIDPQMGSDKESRDFSVRLFLKTSDMTEEADAIVERYTENWELSRIALIDRILLRMGICEMLHFPDIPPKVSINEVIEIAKRYSTDRSGQFINGILDSVLLDFHREKRLKKTGRGLIGLDTIARRAKD